MCQKNKCQGSNELTRNVLDQKKKHLSLTRRGRLQIVIAFCSAHCGAPQITKKNEKKMV